MGVRRKTDRRLTLIRTCGTCGQSFVTCAGSPWMRQVPRDGKRQATTYYCSQTCYQASYKHRFDGLADERRREREAKRDKTEKNRAYYASHREQVCARQRALRAANPEEYAARSAYNREKRKLLGKECCA